MPLVAAQPESESLGSAPLDSAPLDSAPLDSTLAVSQGSSVIWLLLWVGGGVGGGLLLALGVFFAVAWLRGPVGPPANPNAVLPSSGGKGALEAEKEGDAANADATPVAAGGASEAAMPATANPASAVVGSSIPVQGSSTSPDKPDVVPLPVAAKPDATASAKSPAVGADIEAPPGFTPRVPENGSAPAAGAGTGTKVAPAGGLPAVDRPAAEPAAGAIANPAAPTPIAGRFAGLLAEGVADTTTPASVVAARPRAANSDVVSSVPVDEEIRRPRPREIDLAARLADPLQKLQVKEMALVDFVRFMSDLSTVPMTLDADALRFRRLSPRTMVSVDVEQSTVREVWQAALAPLQLGLELGEGQARITDLSMLGAPPRQRMHDVADLTGGDVQRAAALAQWISELIMPGTWAADGGTGRLIPAANGISIEQRELAHHQAMFLCDKLRVARKLAPRGKFPPELLAVGAVPNRARSGLATPIRLNFNRSTRLTQILDRLGTVASVTILVDWTALQAAGWTPETMAKLSVDGKSLAESLAILLTPRELAFRTVDDSTLEVTTPAAVVGHLEWELYPIIDLLVPGVDPSTVIDQLRDVVAAEPLEAPNLETAFRFDAPSGSVLASLPEPHHRAVARWLADRRAATAATEQTATPAAANPATPKPAP
jgi:hypothetical protein